MQEELISYTTAELAKKKGFNVSVNTYYDLSNVFTKDKKSLSEYTIPLDYNSRTKSPQFEERCYISRPTRSLLQRWLREVHNIIVLVEQVDNVNKKGIFYSSGVWIGNNFERYANDKGYSTYEEALEVGLQEALKLIK